jgi:outer membrane protein TolC
MRRVGGRNAALAALCAVLVASAAYGQESSWTRRWADPFKTMGNVAPAPGVPWEPQRPLPPVPAPATASQPDNAAPLALAELTEYALRNNPRTRQAGFAARAAAAGVGIEEADRLPQLSAAFGVTRIRPVSGTTGAVSPWQTRYGPSATLSYVLLDFARAAQIEAGQYRLLAANLNQNRVLQDVVFQVEQAYYRLLGFAALIRVNELTLQNLKTALDAAQRRRESGLATVADVYRAETQVAQAEVNLTRSRGELEKARGQLATAVGLPVDKTLSVQTLSEVPQVKEMTTTVTELLDRARASRPDLVAAEAQARAARSSAEAVSKAALPTIEITGTIGRTSVLDEANRDRPAATNYALGVNVRIPIFTGFRDKYATLQAQALAEQSEASRDTLYRQAELDVWQAYYDVRTAASAVGSTEAQVRSAEQTSQATLARYQAGFGSILDLLTAQQDESNARVQRIQSYLDWFTALARLNFSTGFNDIIAAAGDRK